MQAFSSPIALITGAAKGLGNYLARHLALQGYFVLIHYHQSQQEAVALRDEIAAAGGQAEVLQANLNQGSEVKAMFVKITQQWGRLDVLINNVGNYLKKSLDTISFEEWDSILHNNLNTAFYCTQSAIPLMQKHQYGRIFFTGFAEVGKLTAQPLVTPYFIAKTGLLVLAKSYAKVLAKDNINVHMVSPGVLENSLSQPIDEIPKGRMATLEEFASVIDFLLSDKAGYLTGTHIEVAGGWRL